MPSVTLMLPGYLTIINVVILLSALYFFTSTLASHLLEAFVGIINSRGNQLRARLKTALGGRGGVAGAISAAEAIYNDPLIKSLGTPGKWSDGSPSYIEPAFFARVVSGLFDAADSPVKQSPVIKGLKQGTSDNAQFEAKVIEWFKAVNDRQNGVYTRWSFFRLIVIGLVFATAMDLDTVQIAGAIWANPEAANTMVSKLEKTVQPLGSVDLTKLTAEQTKNLKDGIATAMTGIEQFKAGTEQSQPSYAWQKTPAGTKEWLSKVLGWLLTALATSLGAQFWFNILSEAMKLRAAGPKPETKEAKTSGGKNVQGQGAQAG